MLALATAGVPIAATLFTSIPDRGMGLALPTALITFVLPAYWVGQLWFGPPALVVGLISLGTLSLWTAWRGPRVPLRRFVEASAVFSLGFILVVGIRVVDPSILPAGGEKFLDYGLLKTVLRADQLPPEDFWFAGNSVQYYYGGQLISAILAILSGTPAKYAYNLAFASFYGMLVTTVYDLAGSIAQSRGGSYRVAGVLAAFFVAFASNLVTPMAAILWSLPNGIATSIAETVAATTALDASPILSRDAFSYWTASRVIDGTINEFPLFAWLNGDLHAHMLSTPFLLLATAIAYAYYQTPTDAVGRRRLLVVGAIPPVAGFIAVINTWSFPTAIGVTWLSIAFAPASPRSLLPSTIRPSIPAKADEQGTVLRLGVSAGLAILVACLGILWTGPFFLGPATGGSARTIGVFPDQSSLIGLILIHGWVLLVFGLFFGSRIRNTHTDRLLLGGALIGAIVVGVISQTPAVILVLPLVVFAWFLLRHERVSSFETVLFLAGAGLVLLVEFVYLDAQAGPGRMNTVFKTYMQVWILWGTGAAVAFEQLLPVRLSQWQRWDVRRVTITVVGVVLLIAVSLYGVIALGAHFEQIDEPTLDATTWAQEQHPEEWAAIQFLATRSGQPNIVTAPACWCNSIDSVQPYRWANAPSSFTGVPTVAGWSHEVGYRGRQTYRRRVDDVRTIYTGSWEKRHSLLARYDVRYIYVGPNERALYELDDFASHSELSVVFQNNAVTIYRVPQRISKRG